jgi:uncharacterized protein YdgA (DUF945 family)
MKTIVNKLLLVTLLSTLLYIISAGAATSAETVQVESFNITIDGQSEEISNSLLNFIKLSGSSHSEHSKYFKQDGGIKFTIDTLKINGEFYSNTKLNFARVMNPTASLSELMNETGSDGSNEDEIFKVVSIE